MIQRYLCRYLHCLGNVLIFLYVFLLSVSHQLLLGEFIFPEHLDSSTEPRGAAADSETEYWGVLEESRSER